MKNNKKLLVGGIISVFVATLASDLGVPLPATEFMLGLFGFGVIISALMPMCRIIY